jgi:DNA polymerase I-like protein with 3'-5' exonuclease and polymerase domains
MFSDKDWAEPLLKYADVNKLLGQLAEGGKAWLKLVGSDDKIHHTVDILGTVSGRATHNNPNLAQVPSIRSYKGEEVRSLFIPRKGWKNVGCDLSGVELRCLAHYMYPYDNGAYAKIILEGDIHTANQKAAGLPTRDQAKTFIYALIYGAGDEKIGSIAGGNSKIGKKLKNNFIKKTKGFKELLDSVKKAAKRQHLKGITGRRLHVRSPHSALNVLLQSLGSYIAKEWMIVIDRKIQEEGLRCNQLGWIHDEVQFECHPDDTERLAKLLEESSLEAGENLGIKMPIHSEAKIGNDWKDCH